MPQKRILFKNRTLKISSLLSFRSLTEKIEGIPDYSKLKKSNEDFGEHISYKPCTLRIQMIQYFLIG